MMGRYVVCSTVVNDVKVENKIGDALVHRIIRAHRDGTPWKCCIVIPLLPGFTFPVDHSDASAVCIFGRLVLRLTAKDSCRFALSWNAKTVL
jgi:phospholipase D1/2